MGIKNGPFTHISISPSGKMLALVTPENVIWIVTVDFSKQIVNFATHAPTSPVQLEW